MDKSNPSEGSDQNIANETPSRPEKPEKKKESMRDLVKIAHRNIEERQSKIKPSRSLAILNRLNTNTPLQSRDKIYAVTFGSRFLTPEERLEFDQTKKNVAKYGIVASIVALASGLMGGLLSKRFVKAKVATQHVVFLTLFSASAYFQMYPIITYYSNFADDLFQKHQNEILPFIAKQHQAFEEAEKAKNSKKPGAK